MVQTIDYIQHRPQKKKICGANNKGFTNSGKGMTDEFIY